MGVKLLPAMTHGPDQYLQANSRDFFAFTGDPKAIELKPISTLVDPSINRVEESISGFCCSVSSGKSNAACSPTGASSTSNPSPTRCDNG
mgnify:CR=1 FL=1